MDLKGTHHEEDIAGTDAAAPTAIQMIATVAAPMLPTSPTPSLKMMRTN